MSTTEFARARTEEQRVKRRELILATAAQLLATTRVNDLSLNELARHVGLAKSNVLRYFESREAVLLELHARENSAWLDAVESDLAAAANVDSEFIASVIAREAAARPVFCDLTASVSAVLEHNVSSEVAAAYKRDALANSYRLGDLVGRYLGDLGITNGTLLIGAVTLGIGGIWASSQPSAGMIAAYRDNPELRAFRIDFEIALRELVATVLVGLRYRQARDESTSATVE